MNIVAFECSSNATADNNIVVFNPINEFSCLSLRAYYKQLSIQM